MGKANTIKNMKTDAMGMFLLNFDSNTEQVKMRMRIKFHQITHSEFGGAFAFSQMPRNAIWIHFIDRFASKTNLKLKFALVGNKWELLKIN
jgi:hypothetical protein